MSGTPLTDESLTAVLVHGPRPAFVHLAEYEPAYLRDLETPGYDLRVRELRHRRLRVGEPDAPVNLHCYAPADPKVRVRRSQASGDRRHPRTGWLARIGRFVGPNGLLLVTVR